MSNHVFRYRNIMVYFAIVHLEFQPYKVRQYRCRSCLCLDRDDFLSRDNADNRQTIMLGFVQTLRVASLRYDIRACGLSAYYNIACISISPFQTERVRSARVGIIFGLWKLQVAVNSWGQGQKVRRMLSNDDSRYCYVIGLHFASPRYVCPCLEHVDHIQRDIELGIKKKLTFTRFCNRTCYSDEIDRDFLSQEMMRDWACRFQDASYWYLIILNYQSPT